MTNKELQVALAKLPDDLPVTYNGCVDVAMPKVEMVYPGGYKPKVPVITFGVEFDDND